MNMFELENNRHGKTNDQPNEGHGKTNLTQAAELNAKPDFLIPTMTIGGLMLGKINSSLIVFLMKHYILIYFVGFIWCWGC